ncbi:DNA-formamidopyrimidine glycosylase family protein, partial [Candidatus Omnitrophota bacterium]
MPELPEVETIRRQLQRSLLGKKIVDVVVSQS